MEGLSTFSKTAIGLAKNPLGIIALFIVLIYGFASLVVGLGSHLDAMDKHVIVWFMVLFPIIVLGVFTWLVAYHHTKLYAPDDFKDDAAFLEASKSSLQAAYSIGAALGNWAAKNPGLTVSSEDARKVILSSARLMRSQLQPSRQARREVIAKNILWVDDHPENNIFERQSLEAMGLNFTQVKSTEEALSALSRTSFSAVISDMGRPPDPQAGYTLLDAIRAESNKVPFLIYAGSKTPDHVAEGTKRGAQGVTNRPEELFEMVLQVLGMD